MAPCPPSPFNPDTPSSHGDRVRVAGGGAAGMCAPAGSDPPVRTPSPPARGHMELNDES